MSKRHVQELFQATSCILEDAALAYPDLVGEFNRDRTRLAHLSENRGVHLYCVDLPGQSKHLERCLDSGTYKPSALPCSRAVAGGVVIPRFLRGLYLRVFGENGKLKEDCDVEAIYFLRQILAFGKRTKLQCSEYLVRQEVGRFVLNDARLEPAGPFWACAGSGADDLPYVAGGFEATEQQRGQIPIEFNRLGWRGDKVERQTFLRNLDAVSRILCRELGPYRYEDWRFRHGPGTIADGTRFENKYLFRNWSDRLETVFPFADCGFHNYSSWARYVRRGGVSSYEPASRLMDVPKTLTKPRLIAAEPREHQWCQQNVWHYFRVRTSQSPILSKFVNFHEQRRNQELCLRGSQDGTLVTLDLSAASDCVTCGVVQNLFRWQMPLLRALRACRTHEVKIGATLAPDEIDLLWTENNRPLLPVVRKDPRGITMELRKFATMGSAVTFPTETLVFLAITLAAALTSRDQKVTVQNIEALEGEVAVFGDDIVAPKSSLEMLLKALEYFYFQVNTAKSFWNGLFRESCGVDAFRGQDITPVYWSQPCERSPESISATYELANGLYKRFLVRTASHVESTMPMALPLVPYGSGVLGWQSFVTPCTPGPFKTRWNGVLQRKEILAPTLSSVVNKTPIQDDTALLQFFTEEPEPFTHWKGGIAQRPRLKTRPRWHALSDYTG